MENNIFYGKILPDLDPLHRGYYKVHIFSEEYHIPENQGIWCKNAVHGYRSTPDSKGGVYGQYYPLHPGTKVQVRFLENDFNTGEIIKVVSDEEEIKKFPLSSKPGDRDQITQIFRTHKYNNFLVVNEETTGQVKDSIHFSYHDGQTKIIIDQNGIHIYTKNNENITIEGDANINIKGNLKLEVSKDIEIKCKNFNLIAEENIKTSSGKTTDINGGKSVNIDGKDSFNTRAKDTKISGSSKITLAAPSIKIGGKGASASIGDGTMDMNMSGNYNLNASQINLNSSSANVQNIPPDEPKDSDIKLNENKGFFKFSDKELKF